MANGALESQALVVPVGGWSADIDDGVAPFTVTVPAGTYSPTSLLVAFEAAIEAGSGANSTWSASIASGEGGSGACTINTSPGTLEIVWTSTDLRDALGFVSDVATSNTVTSDYGVRGLWLPDCPLDSRYGSQDPGHTEGGPAQTVSPLGVIKTISRPTYVRLPPVRWSHVTAARARQAAESGVPRSYERFIREVVYGNASGVSYFTPGGVVRLIWNANVPGTYTDYYPIAARSTALERTDPSWSGLYSCSFEGNKKL
jgi:hypothetical protein